MLARNPTGADEDEAELRGTSKRGQFFCVDRRQFHRACELGTTELTVFMAFARGAGRPDRIVRWGVNSIEKRTNISRHRARAALDRLISVGLMDCLEPEKRAKGWVKYALLPAIDPSTGEILAPELMYLPNAFVDGAAGETPPLERVRQTLSISVMRLAIDLYHYNALPESEGVSWRHGFGVWREFERSLIYERGAWRVFAFKAGSLITTKAFRAALGYDGPERAQDFFSELGTICQIGLLEHVALLIEEPDGEVIHSLTRTSEPDEIAVAEACHAASLRLVPEGREHLLAGHATAPVLAHRTEVQVVGVFRCRYRPATRATIEWSHTLRQRQRQFALLYDGLGA